MVVEDDSTESTVRVKRKTTISDVEDSGSNTARLALSDSCTATLGSVVEARDDDTVLVMDGDAIVLLLATKTLLTILLEVGS